MSLAFFIFLLFAKNRIFADVCHMRRPQMSESFDKFWQKGLTHLGALKIEEQFLAFTSTFTLMNYHHSSSVTAMTSKQIIDEQVMIIFLTF